MLVLNNDTTFFKLYKNAPDYSFLQNFRCICYPLLRLGVFTVRSGSVLTQKYNQTEK